MCYQGRNWRVLGSIGTDKVLIASVSSSEKRVVLITQLSPALHPEEPKQAKLPFAESPAMQEAEKWMDVFALC